MKKIFWAVFLCLVLTPLRLWAEEGIRKDEVRALLGEAYVVEQDHTSAIRQYKLILDREPANDEIRIKLAKTLSWEKRYPEAISEYQEVLRRRPKNVEAREGLAQIYLWQGDYLKAEHLYEELFLESPQDPAKKLALAEALRGNGGLEKASVLLGEILQKDPQNLKARVLAADIDAERMNFSKAEAGYEQALSQKYDRDVKAKLAATLSWARDYRKSLRLYDELLAEKEDRDIRLQKARVLGWERKYSQSLREYRKILERGADREVELEMKAKELYWNQRVERSIAAYEDLLGGFPGNAEGRFDLAQIYSYQGMWQEARESYDQLLSLFPRHFRAKAGLEKVRLMSSRAVTSSNYEFFRARSTARDVDIRKNVASELVSVPLGAHTMFGIGYALVRRAFLDFHDLTENHARVELGYQRNPAWSTSGFFNLVTYHQSVAPVYEFGGKVSVRTFDVGQLTFSQEQKRLENNSEVIRRRLFRDDFKVRQEVDISRRLKAGTDYVFSYFSDHNQCEEVGADTLYYFSLEPKAFYVKYRYAFRDFRRVETDYFSPQDYSLHTISLRWKHFLNKNEIFFGANDVAYETGYDISFDSTGITTHQIMGGIVWDITQRLQLKGGGQYTHGSSRIYEDTGAKVSLKYFF